MIISTLRSKLFFHFWQCFSCQNSKSVRFNLSFSILTDIFYSFGCTTMRNKIEFLIFLFIFHTFINILDFLFRKSVCIPLVENICRVLIENSFHDWDSDSLLLISKVIGFFFSFTKVRFEWLIMLINDGFFLNTSTGCQRTLHAVSTVIMWLIQREILRLIWSYEETLSFRKISVLSHSPERFLDINSCIKR